MSEVGRPRFALHVVATRDGFIARAPGHAPADWASAEEQAIFLAEVGAADWAAMGRGTHEAAFRPDRRRIVFSRSAPEPEWRGESHLWLDPAGRRADDLAALVAGRRPMRTAVVLGGTGVHDWFEAQGRIDEVLLTVEPVAFGGGLPIFSDQPAAGPEEIFRARGYRTTRRERLNAGGTERLRLEPSRDREGGPR